MIALATTNNMMRSLGLNIPPADDRIFDPEFGYLADYHLTAEQDAAGCRTDPSVHELTIMDAAGWSDDLGVDEFHTLSIDDQLAYAAGMGFDFDEF